MGGSGAAVRARARREVKVGRARMIGAPLMLFYVNLC